MAIYEDSKIYMEVGYKKCTKCLICLEETEFSVRPKYPNKRQSWCKKCTAIGAKPTPEKERERYKRRVASGEILNKGIKIYPQRALLSQAKGRAKKCGIPFDLELSDIVIPDRCPVIGIELKRNPNGSGPIPSSPSLDRIVPSFGYTKGNVRVISHRANTLKSDATLLELTQILADAYKLAAT